VEVLHCNICACASTRAIHFVTVRSASSDLQIFVVFLLQCWDAGEPAGALGHSGALWAEGALGWIKWRESVFILCWPLDLRWSGRFFLLYCLYIPVLLLLCYMLYNYEEFFMVYYQKSIESYSCMCYNIKGMKRAFFRTNGMKRWDAIPQLHKKCIDNFWTSHVTFSCTT
jgi:hypothetical protein